MLNLTVRVNHVFRPLFSKDLKKYNTILFSLEIIHCVMTLNFIYMPSALFQYIPLKKEQLQQIINIKRNLTLQMRNKR